jgi:hypothetical protein
MFGVHAKEFGLVPLDEMASRERMGRMLANSDIQKVFKEHVTTYRQQSDPSGEATVTGTPSKSWRWSCTCGQDKTLSTREMCQTETHNHWSAKIVELQPAEEPVGHESDHEAPTIPTDLSILSFVVCEVDCNRLTMPQGRKMVSEWIQKQRILSSAATRDRLRRLKQITDAIYEEVSTTLASSGANA